MRKGGGHAKGSEFERYCCKRFSRWVSNGARDDLFWRTASSGGRATFQFRTKGELSVAQAGDMGSIAAAGHPLVERCVFEFKFYSDLQLDSAVFKGIGGLWGFWDRVCEDGILFNKAPVLIAKQNRYNALAIVRHGFDLFDDAARLLTSDLMRADIYNFEQATEVPEAKMTRRA